MLSVRARGRPPSSPPRSPRDSASFCGKPPQGGTGAGLSAMTATSAMRGRPRRSSRSMAPRLRRQVAPRPGWPRSRRCKPRCTRPSTERSGAPTLNREIGDMGVFAHGRWRASINDMGGQAPGWGFAVAVCAAHAVPAQGHAGHPGGGWADLRGIGGDTGDQVSCRSAREGALELGQIRPVAAALGRDVQHLGQPVSRSAPTPQDWRSEDMGRARISEVSPSATASIERVGTALRSSWQACQKLGRPPRARDLEQPAQPRSSILHPGFGVRRPARQHVLGVRPGLRAARTYAQDSADGRNLEAGGNRLCPMNPSRRPAA